MEECVELPQIVVLVPELLVDDFLYWGLYVVSLWQADGNNLMLRPMITFVDSPCSFLAVMSMSVNA